MKDQIKLLQGERLLKTARPRRGLETVDVSQAAEPIPATDGRKSEPTIKTNPGESPVRMRLISVSGTGRDRFPLPTPDELIEACVAYINQVASAQRQQRRVGSGGSAPRNRTQGGAEDNKPSSTQVPATHGIGDFILNVLNDTQLGCVASRNKRKSILRKGRVTRVGTIESTPEPFAAKEKTAILSKAEQNSKLAPAGDPTLWAAAGGLADIMYDGRFEAHIAAVFDVHFGAIDWARKNLDKKYQSTVESLNWHFEQLSALYPEVLPTVVHALAAIYREATEDQLIDAAVTVVNMQLQQILFVLSMWTNSFMQQRDGKYEELSYVVFTLEQCLALFANPKVKNLVLQVGDVFMPRYGGEGPATIPGGARGPLHAHLIEVQLSGRRALIINMPAFLHEFRHDFYEVAESLPEQTAQKVLEAMDKAAAEGRFKFKSDFITLGDQKVSTYELIRQIYVQTLSETDADLAGGVLLSGSAFLFLLIVLFSALNTMGKSIFSTQSLLRGNGNFRITSEMELLFGVHMPDYIRIYVAAAALEILGFKDKAEECRRLADQAAGGSERPENIVWTNANPKDKRFRFKVEVPFSDLLQVAPVVANAIINSPLDCLGGLSNGQLIYWDSNKEEKSQHLAELIIAGESTIPAEFGDVYATYVVAAASTAYWTLCKKGMQPRKAAAHVEKHARSMMDGVRRRLADKAKQETAGYQVPAA